MWFSRVKISPGSKWVNDLKLPLTRETLMYEENEWVVTTEDKINVQIPYQLFFCFSDHVDLYNEYSISNNGL